MIVDVADKVDKLEGNVVVCNLPTQQILKIRDFGQLVPFADTLA